MPAKPNRHTLLTTVAVLGVLALAGVHARTLLAPPPAAAAGRVGLTPAGPLTLRLHGSTPSLAWAPDSSRVAVASAYEYYGFGGRPKQHQGNTGIYVVDPKQRKHVRVSTDQGYHPVWIDKRTLAWGHSPYEDGTPGLYVARLTRKGSTVRRVGTYKGVYHTRKSTRRGRVIFYSGWPEYRRWVEVNVGTGALTSIAAAGRDSWVAPPKRTRSQCLQKVGQIKTGVTASGRFLLETATQNVSVPGTAFRFYNYNGTGRRTSCSSTGHCGPVKPCLSPNGRWLAYVTAGATAGSFELRILPVPR